MAFLSCERHGGHVAPLVCPHLHEAVRRRSSLPEIVRVEAWYLGEPAGGQFLCRDCAREIGAAESPTIWKDDDSLDRLDRDVVPVCPLCFDEARVVANPQS